MARFNKNTLYTTKDIARAIMAAYPNHYKTEHSCIATVSFYIKKRGIQSVNKQQMFRVFSGIDSEAVYKEIEAVIRTQEKEGKQLEFDLTPISTNVPTEYLKYKEPEIEEGFNSEQLRQLETIIRKAVEDIILPELVKSLGVQKREEASR